MIAAMKELFRTNNPTVISYVEHLMKEAGLKAFVMDSNASILDGSVGVLPRRIMIVDEDYERARKVLIEADLEHELKA